MDFLWISVGIAALLFAMLLVGAYLAYRMAFSYRGDPNADPYSTLSHHPEFEDRRRAYVDKIVSLPYESVRITSRDGLSLFARYYHVRDGAPLEIQFHGYKSIAVRDFSASGEGCYRDGYNLLLVDQRAHGNSEGRVISFGIKERFDCLDWIDYAVERFGREQKIILYGISMGAATVLMAAGESLPDNVVGVIADCPYSSPIDIIARVARRMHIPVPITKIIAPLGARLFGGFSLSECTPLEAIERAQVPVLLFHGEADSFVPCEMSRKIAAKNKDVRFVTVPEAGHGFSYLVDTEGYIRELHDFVERVTRDK